MRPMVPLLVITAGSRPLKLLRVLVILLSIIICIFQAATLRLLRLLLLWLHKYDDLIVSVVTFELSLLVASSALSTIVADFSRLLNAMDVL